MPELRRQRRVVYHTKVRLRSADRDHSVIARVQNLSSTGIFVTGPEVPEPGSDVLCRLLVAGERRTLRGRVAWVRPPGEHASDEAVSGAGIRFLELTDQDVELLARMIEPSQDDRQAVDVWFEGLKSPIKSHATVAEQGLLISTRLPFLRLNSPVKVSFVRRGVEELREGILEGVTLEPSAEDGIPRLQLVVSTPHLEHASGTIEAQTPRPVRPTPIETMLLSGVSAAPVAVPPLPPASVSAKVPPVVAPPPPPVLPRSIAVDDDRTQRLRLDTFVPPAKSGAYPPVPATVRPARRGRGLLLVAVGVAAGVAVTIGMQQTPRDVVLPEPSHPAPAPLVIETRPPPNVPPPAATSPAASQPAAEVPPPVEEPLAEKPTLKPVVVPAGLDLSHDGGKLAIAIAGTTKGMKSYELADPPGLAINLPRARPRVGAGVHGLDGRVFSRVLVQRRGAGSHLRIFVTGDKVPEVDAAGSTLRLSVPAKKRR